MQLKRYKDNNISGEIIWKEWKETAVHSSHSGTERRDDQSDDGETRPSWDSKEKALTTKPYSARDDNENPFA
jgi:hypothetical protein